MERNQIIVCSTECNVHENYKTAVINAKERDAVVSGRSTGHPVRSLKNKLTKQFEDCEKNGATPEEIERLGRGKLRAIVVDGDTEYGSIMAGQVAGLVKEVKSCDEIVQELMGGIKKVICDMQMIAN